MKRTLTRTKTSSIIVNFFTNILTNRSAAFRINNTYKMNFVNFAERRKGPDMKKILRLISILMAINAVISCAVIFAQASDRTYIFDSTYTTENPMKPGTHSLSLNADATHTLFIFSPDEIGVYTFTVDETATVGWWGAYPAVYVRDPKSEVNVIEREIKKVGDVAVIGISSPNPQITLSITKTGSSEGIVEIEYTDYKNVHTPNEKYIPKGAATPVDITQPHTAIMDSTGAFHLDSIDGPKLYVDLYFGNEFSFATAFGDYGALSMKGQCDGVNYNFKNAMKEYNKVLTGTGGVYPLTIDLVRFLQSYGAAQMWFKPDFSPFDKIKDGTADPDTAWMVMCCTVSGEPVEDFTDDLTPTEPEETTVEETTTAENITSVEETTVIEETTLPEETTAEPETSEPETSEPETSEPETSEPETSEPETSEPETSEPETSEPETSEPETSEPETSEPETSEPETSEPETSEPETSEPETSEPETSEPEISEPEISESETKKPSAAPPSAEKDTTNNTPPDNSSSSGKSGCGSSLSGGAAVLFASLSLAWFAAFRKKEE